MLACHVCKSCASDQPLWGTWPGMGLCATTELELSETLERTLTTSAGRSVWAEGACFPHQQSQQSSATGTEAKPMEASFSQPATTLAGPTRTLASSEHAISDLRACPAP